MITLSHGILCSLLLIELNRQSVLRKNVVKRIYLLNPRAVKVETQMYRSLCNPIALLRGELQRKKAVV